MADRYYRKAGEHTVVPILTAQAVTKGDLVKLSSGNLVRASDETWVTDLATTQRNFVQTFLGVSAQDKAANDARVWGNGADNIIRVDVGGVYEFDCASATFNVGDLVGPAKQAGNALEDQKVVAVASEQLAIGRVEEKGTSVTKVLVRVLSNSLNQSRVGSSRYILSIPISLAQITGAGDVLTTLPMSHAFKILSLDAYVKVIATTASKAATLNAEIGTTNLTGGAVALTTANCGTLGAKIAGTAVTGNNTGNAGDTISIEAASVTAFAEGEVILMLDIENRDNN